MKRFLLYIIFSVATLGAIPEVFGYQKGYDRVKNSHKGVGIRNKAKKIANKQSKVSKSLPKSETNISFGKNFDKKVRKHIDQVRKRHDKIENIPSPNKGGSEKIKEIIQNRVFKGGGRKSTYASEPAIFYEDGGVSYVFKENGEFWTILKN